MSRMIFSALSALAVVTTGTVLYFWNKPSSSGSQILEKVIIKEILIKLRKRIFSTLRQIVFIVNNIRTLEGDLEVKKISQIFMRDGGSGQKKLTEIQRFILEQYQVSQKDFEFSCEYYNKHDLEIKILVQDFKRDLNMALEGVISTYHGPVPLLNAEKILKIHSQIIRRRMQIINKKYTQKLTDIQCLKLQFQIQEYLQLQGIKHDRQPNEKIFRNVLQYYYRNDYQFKEQFQQIQFEMELYMIQIQNQKKQNMSEHQKKLSQAKNILIQQVYNEQQKYSERERIFKKLQLREAE